MAGTSSSAQKVCPAGAGLLLASAVALSVPCLADPVDGSMPDTYPTLPGSGEPPSLIMGEGQLSPDQLVSFFMGNNPGADEEKVIRLASMYVEECALEGVNSDVAFAQMCLETGFLRFGGLVTDDMNNFCGLGATDAAHTGLYFPDERTGVRAHVQHLKAYGSTEPLVCEQVDPRYPYVIPKGKSPSIQGLAGTWAADRNYGDKLADIIERMFGQQD